MEVGSSGLACSGTFWHRRRRVLLVKCLLPSPTCQPQPNSPSIPQGRVVMAVSHKPCPRHASMAHISQPPITKKRWTAQKKNKAADTDMNTPEYPLPWASLPGHNLSGQYTGGWGKGAALEMSHPCLYRVSYNKAGRDREESAQRRRAHLGVGMHPFFPQSLGWSSCWSSLPPNGDLVVWGWDRIYPRTVIQIF